MTTKGIPRLRTGNIRARIIAPWRWNGDGGEVVPTCEEPNSEGIAVIMRRGMAVSVGVLAAAAAALTACSSSSSSSSNTTSAAAPATSSSASSAETSSAASSSAASAGLPWGSGCASLGVTPAQLTAASKLPVAVAAAAVPQLKTVVTAATVAGMVSTLNSAPSLTVFAPLDSAFAKEPAGLLQSLITDPSKKAQLVSTLKYHVVEGELTKEQLPGTHKTLEGSTLTITGSGDSYTINGTVKIVCGGIMTKNAVVNVIDGVLHPKS
jgi:uncharacterized surface protein with fasciclin (FAS1) repeats